MDNELLLKLIGDILDKKLDPINERLDTIDGRLDNIDGRLDTVDRRLDTVDRRLGNLEKTQDEIKKTQDTIINFITQADSEFVRLEEKAKEIDKIKKVINISNIK